MSIVRVGLAETKKYAEGYDAIFGKKKSRAASTSKKSSRKTTAKRKSGRK